MDVKWTDILWNLRHDPMADYQWSEMDPSFLATQVGKLVTFYVLTLFVLRKREGQRHNLGTGHTFASISATVISCSERGDDTFELTIVVAEDPNGATEGIALGEHTLLITPTASRKGSYGVDLNLYVDSFFVGDLIPQKDNEPKFEGFRSERLISAQEWCPELAA